MLPVTYQAPHDGQCLAQGASQGGHSHRAVQWDLPASCLPPMTALDSNWLKASECLYLHLSLGIAFPCSHFSPGSLGLTPSLGGKLLAVILGLPIPLGIVIAFLGHRGCCCLPSGAFHDCSFPGLLLAGCCFLGCLLLSSSGFLRDRLSP